MKTIIKYISLLLISGLVQPIYYQTITFKIVAKESASKIDNAVANGFSFYDDFAAKVYPPLKYLK